MRHPSNRSLFDYWDQLRAGRAAPDRSDIEPRAIAAILGDTFVLEADMAGGLVYRLAGSRACALFGHEMKGLSFLDQFHRDSRESVGRALADALGATAGLGIEAEAVSATGRKLPVEFAVLPLVHRGRLGARMIGSAAADEAPYWMDRDGIVRLSARRCRLLWPGQAGEAVARAAGAPAPAFAGAARPVLRVIAGGLA